jgi:hypothetical protein
MPQNDLHDLIEVLGLGHEKKILQHVLRDPFRSQTMPDSFFGHAVLDDAADLIRVFDHGQSFESITDHHFRRLGHALRRLDADHGRGHEILDHHLGIYERVEQGK